MNNPIQKLLQDNWKVLKAHHRRNNILYSYDQITWLNNADKFGLLDKNDFIKTIKTLRVDLRHINKDIADIFSVDIIESYDIHCRHKNDKEYSLYQMKYSDRLIDKDIGYLINKIEAILGLHYGH